MAWITATEEGDASGRLEELYREAADPESGRVDEVLRIHSAHPNGLAAHLAVYRAGMASTPGLRRVDRELIAYVVSAINACHY